jgi:hypothetical protein
MGFPVDAARWRKAAYTGRMGDANLAYARPEGGLVEAEGEPLRERPSFIETKFPP